MQQLSYRDRNANEVTLHPQAALDTRTRRVLTMGTKMVDSIQMCTRGSKVLSMGTTHLLACTVLMVHSMVIHSLRARTIMDIKLMIHALKVSGYHEVIGLLRTFMQLILNLFPQLLHSYCFIYTSYIITSAYLFVKCT